LLPERRCSRGSAGCICGIAAVEAQAVAAMSAAAVEAVLLPSSLSTKLKVEAETQTLLLFAGVDAQTLLLRDYG